MRWGRNRNEVGNRNGDSPRQVIQPELNRDEKLLWVDRPISVASHFKSAIPLCLFGLLFAGMPLFVMFSTYEKEGWSQGLLFLSIFVLVGLCLAFSPFWRMKKAKSTVYAFTDQRMIIRQNFPSVNVRSWPLSGITSLQRNGPAEGPGDIIFDEEPRVNQKGRTYIVKHGFIGIDQPKRLEDEIREQLDW